MPTRSRSRSNSRRSLSIPKKGAKRDQKSRVLEVLCQDAIKQELAPGNTKDGFFWLLGAIQLPVIFMLSRFVLQDKRFEMVALISMAGHWTGYIVAEMIGSDKWFDVTEDFTLLFCFIWMHVTIKGDLSPSQIAIGTAAYLWIARLVGFLGYRIIKRGSDWRFDALIKNRAYNFFGWTSGATWCYFQSFCLLVLCGKGVQTGPIKPLTWVGIAIWAVGLCVETLSDIQKYQFREYNKTGFITRGLWAYSRHPNYLGEMTCWVGLSVAVVGAISFDVVSYEMKVCLCLVSPLWSAFFLFFTSLMLLEKGANEKWGKRKSYKDYKDNTPILLPFHF